MEHNPKLCRIPKCGYLLKRRGKKLYLQKGLCNTHYIRLRKYGDPHITRKPANGTLLREFMQNYRVETDRCIIWPYHKMQSGGYGKLTYKGKEMRIHRLALLLTKGAGDTAKSHALHHCNKPSCYNPRHLYWGDDADNAKDRVRAGTVPKGENHASSKLTEAQVREIKNNTTFSNSEMAVRLGIQRHNVYDIRSGKAWVHI